MEEMEQDIERTKVNPMEIIMETVMAMVFINMEFVPSVRKRAY